jgi:hypothetical protein
MCLTALIQLKDAKLMYDDLAYVLQLLPEAVHQLPEHSAWVERCLRCLCIAAAAGRDVLPLLLQICGDVHALLTSPGQLLHFRQLPFSAIKAWAGSDDLVVDSEDSVAVVLGWWVGGEVGSKYSLAQLKELSGLLRLKHLDSSGEQCHECDPHPLCVV